MQPVVHRLIWFGQQLWMTFLVHLGNSEYGMSAWLNGNLLKRERWRLLTKKVIKQYDLILIKKIPHTHLYTYTEKDSEKYEPKLLKWLSLAIGSIF